VTSTTASLPTLYVEHAYELAPYAFAHDADLSAFSVSAVHILSSTLAGSGWRGEAAQPKIIGQGIAEHDLEPGWTKASPLVRVVIPTADFASEPGISHYRFSLDTFGDTGHWTSAYYLEKSLATPINDLYAAADVQLYRDGRDKINELLRHYNSYVSVFRLGRLVTRIASKLLPMQYKALGVDTFAPTVTFQSLLFTKDEEGVVHVGRSEEPLV
jgi:hypothetical protein